MDVISYTLRYIVFDHRHVFIGRCVIDSLDREGAENRFETLFIADASQQGHHWKPQALPLAHVFDLSINAVKREF